MKWQKLVLDTFQKQAEELEKVVSGLIIAELDCQPAPGCNSIGWLAWHAVRVTDKNMSVIIGEEQVYIKGKWYERFIRPADPDDTGMGHTSEQVRGFQSPDPEVFIGYQKALLNRLRDYIETLTEKELSRKVMWATHQKTDTVEAVIAGQIWSAMHHIGQAGYVRGMIKGNNWYGR